MKVILGRADGWCRNTNGPRAALQEQSREEDVMEDTGTVIHKDELKPSKCSPRNTFLIPVKDLQINPKSTHFGPEEHNC